jgi:hypothetical protein
MPELLSTGLSKRAEAACAPERVSRRRTWRDDVNHHELADIAAAFTFGGVAVPEVVRAAGTNDCAASINAFPIAHWFELAPPGGIPPLMADGQIVRPNF